MNIEMTVDDPCLQLCPLLPLLDAINELPGQMFFVVASLLGRFKTLMKKV